MSLSYLFDEVCFAWLLFCCRFPCVALTRKLKWHKVVCGLRVPAATGLHRGAGDIAGKKNELMLPVWNVGASSFQGFCTKHLGRDPPASGRWSDAQQDNSAQMWLTSGISTGRNKHQESCESSPDDQKVLCTPPGQASCCSSNPAQTSCCCTASVHAWLGGLALPTEPYGDEQDTRQKV